MDLASGSWLQLIPNYYYIHLKVCVSICVRGVRRVVPSLQTNKKENIHDFQMFCGLWLLEMGWPSSPTQDSWNLTLWLMVTKDGQTHAIKLEVQPTGITHRIPVFHPPPENSLNCATVGALVVHGFESGLHNSKDKERERQLLSI